jgi:2-polyprenyl-3-methyl-5-hydroxy-6-metoxy-1,4-benzoquinol methylase
MKFSVKKNKDQYFEAHPKPSSNFLKNFYEKTYFNKKTSATYSKIYSKDEIKNKKNRSAFYIKIAKSFIKKNKIKFLEIGCGEGFLLKAAFKENLSVLGVDYQNNHVKKFNKSVFKFSQKIDPDSFLSKKNNSKFDIIAAINVLEHVRDPTKFVNNLKSFLNKSGIIILSVPNDFKKFQNLLQKRKFIKRKYWFGPPQHLSYFNNENILIFFKKLNLKIIEAVSDFPIEIFLTLSKKNYTNNKKSGKEAHKARLIIDNFILSQKHKISLDFYRSCHSSGLGRGMIFFLKNKT